MRFKQTALVTGGAKRIGAEIVKILAKRGFAIAVHYHQSKNAVEHILEALKKKGVPAQAIQADLTDRAQFRHLFDALDPDFPPLTVLVNNASIFERDEWDTVDEKIWDAHMRTNLEAPYWLSRAMAERLPKHQEGVIINMIDQRVWNLTPHFVSYSLAKSALLSLTKILALALAPTIRVNGIGPGPTLPSPRQSKQQFETQWKMLPLSRQVSSKDICRAVEFILDTKTLTGQMLAVDSGQHLGWTHGRMSQGDSE